MKSFDLYSPGIRRLHKLAAERQHLGRPNCYEGNPEDWHPSTVAEQEATDAAGLCFGCPILQECRLYALANRDLSGVWGGLSETERTEYRKQLRRAS